MGVNKDKKIYPLYARAEQSFELELSWGGWWCKGRMAKPFMHF